MKTKEIKRCQQLVVEVSGWLKTAHLKAKQGYACDECIQEAKVNCEKLEYLINHLVNDAENEEAFNGGESKRRLKEWLAHAALTGGTSVEDTKQFYEWIIEPTKQPNEINSLSIHDFFDEFYFSQRMNVELQCHNNGIETVGDMLRMGKTKFLSIKGIGKKSLTAIDDHLEQAYGIKHWKV